MNIYIDVREDHPIYSDIEFAVQTAGSKQGIDYVKELAVLPEQESTPGFSLPDYVITLNGDVLEFRKNTTQGMPLFSIDCRNLKEFELRQILADNIEGAIILEKNGNLPIAIFGIAFMVGIGASNILLYRAYKRYRSING